MGGIFINYRTSDGALGAVLLDAKLSARFGAARVFRDQRSIPLATVFDQLLWTRLRASDVVIVVIGPHWLSESANGTRLIDRPDDFVRKEIAEALREGIDVLPVLIGDAALPQPHELPPDLQALSRYQFRHIRARDPEPDIDRLVEELAARPDLATAPLPPEKAPERERSIKIGKARAGRDMIFGDRISGGRA